MTRTTTLLTLVSLFVAAASANAENHLLPTERSIQIFQERVDKRPSDYRSAIVLAQLFMRQAKEDDDFDAYLNAESILHKAARNSPNAIEVKSHLAGTMLAQHRFADARSIAASVLDQRSDSTIALSILGDANLQLGNYSQARDAFERLLRLEDSPTANIRLARYHELVGNTSQAIQLATKSLRQQRQKYSLRSIECWYHWRLAKLNFDHGQLEEAKKQLSAALRLVPYDAESLALMGKLLCFQGQTDVAIAHLKRAIEKAEKPPFLIVLGDVYLKCNRKRAATEAYDRASLLMAEEAEHPKAGPAHARERAAFLLDQNRDLSLALSLAKEDFKLRSDLYCHDLLAWAHFKNGNLQQAKISIDCALSVGSKDARIHFHAGMIQAALGNVDEAIQSLEFALAANPYFSIHGAKIAANKLKELKANLAFPRRGCAVSQIHPRSGNW